MKISEENKELLLKDLCARLIYNVIVEYRGAKVNLTQYARSVRLEDCKPYLRPMSSMTKEEKETYYNLYGKEEIEGFNFGGHRTRYFYHDRIDSIDYLNSIHIDYRGLIPMNLALEAPKDMYNIK